MFRHPKYYKELRKRNKETQQEPQRILDKPGRSVSNSDQVVSPRVATATARRAPGPGQQLGEVQPCDRKATPSSKLQAREDSTANSTRGRVAEPQASSVKLKATSDKLPDS